MSAECGMTVRPLGRRCNVLIVPRVRTSSGESPMRPSRSGHAALTRTTLADIGRNHVGEL
jgi:hypothetical protein